MITLKTGAIIVGLVLSVIGLILNNWKIAVLGNSVAIFASLFA